MLDLTLKEKYDKEVTWADTIMTFKTRGTFIQMPQRRAILLKLTTMCHLAQKAGNNLLFWRSSEKTDVPLKRKTIPTHTNVARQRNTLQVRFEAFLFTIDTIYTN
jgi:hypothetical protein